MAVGRSLWLLTLVSCYVSPSIDRGMAHREQETGQDNQGGSHIFFYNHTLEVTSHNFHPKLFIKSEFLGPTYTQGERDTQGPEYQR